MACSTAGDTCPSGTTKTQTDFSWRGLSAELVTAKDIIEFDLDSRPVDTHGLPMSALFTERYIHGEIYKMRAPT